MKISLDWLRDYVDYTDGPDRLADLLTRIGFPVENMAPVGADWMLDVEITSNRPDCLGHVGIAREVAAATGLALKLPQPDPTGHGPDVSTRTSVVDEEPAWCSRYTARIIDSVKIGPSPEWMVRRLETIGLRGINNVVDITNYVMMEVGQPLHAFDHARLRQGRIVVRRAQRGERLELIDHSTMELDENMLVIADASHPVALAGVMGGLASEVAESTTTILLESAHFDPLNIRRTSRNLALGSESSYRFERNVDPIMLEWASRRAAALLAEIAAGQVAPGMIDVWPARNQQSQSRDVTMRLSRLKLLLGIDLDADYVTKLLAGLGLEPQRHNDEIVCTIPSWRGDLEREVDLIEEVIRLHGYDSVPTEKRIHIHIATPDPWRRTTDNVTRTLNGCGYFETVNVSFVEESEIALFTPESFEPLRVRDQARRTSKALRPTVLPSLLEARKRNQDAGNGRCDLYEISAVHRPRAASVLPQEDWQLGLLTDGDFWELRGVIESLATRLDPHAAINCEQADVPWAGPGQGAVVLLDGEPLGCMGQAGPAVLREFDLENPLCLAELDFSALVSRQGRDFRIKPLLRFPPIERDLSLIVEEALPWAQLEAVIRNQKIDQLQEVRFGEIYRGKHIPAGRKSVMLSLEFRHPDRTLTHEEVDALQGRILAALEKQCAAQLRTV